MDLNKKAEVFRKARLAFGITTTNAADSVFVAKRTVEMWENRSREVPDGMLELFVIKALQKREPSDPEILVIYDQRKMPIDVIASDLFLHLETTNQAEGKYVISSMHTDRETGRPYIHRTAFEVEPNNHNNMLRFTKDHWPW